MTKKQLETLQKLSVLLICGRHQHWIDSFIGRKTIVLRSFRTMSSECSLRQAWKIILDMRRLFYLMILLFLHPDPIVCDLFTSLLYIFSLFFSFWWNFFSEFTDQSCYLASKIFSNQISIERKSSKGITKWMYLFILFSLYRSKGWGQKGKVPYVKK